MIMQKISMIEYKGKKYIYPEYEINPDIEMQSFQSFVRYHGLKEGYSNLIDRYSLIENMKASEKIIII